MEKTSYVICKNHFLYLYLWEQQSGRQTPSAALVGASGQSVS